MVPTNAPPSAELEAFALRAHHYGRITGVSMAVHSIPDAFLLLHTGVGCKYKAAAQLSVHDWARQPHRREGWTEVGDAPLIRGAAERIGPYVRSWYDRQKPGLIIVTTASHLEMAGEDIADAVRRADATVPCPVRYVHGLGFAGDLYDGYRAVVSTVLDEIPWSDVRPQKGRVAIVGYPFDRYESDQWANLHQLRNLIREVGRELVAVVPSGQPMARLAEAARAETLLVLPYAHALTDQLAATGRQVVQTDLPVGLRCTTAWLDHVARELGADHRKTAAAARRLAGYAEKELNLLRTRLVGGRSAVFAETPLAAGLTDLLDGLGLPPVLVGLRGRSLGGARALRKSLAPAGVDLRSDAVILDDPSLWTARAHLREGLSKGQILTALGSAAELGNLSQGHPGVGGGDGSEVHRFAPLILGFPSSGYHALGALPTYGFGGAVTVGQRLLDGLFGGQA
jgi:nitrogenase molybdenum-iron protein alpha/beta subunit